MYGQINKLFIIGNGFDLSHGLKTGYCDFINYIWEEEKKSFIDSFDSNLVAYKPFYYNSNLFSIKIPVVYNNNPRCHFNEDLTGYDYFNIHPNFYHRKDIPLNNEKIEISIKNKFIKHISEKESLEKWVDIEEEYYLKLKDCLVSTNNDDIINLNHDFDNLRLLLNNYLSLEMKKEINLISQIIDKFKNILQPELIAGNQTLNDNDRILFLNFNYTNTDKLYINYFKNIISQIIESNNIHGEIDNANNPIIFGYGDELDEEHKKIENMNNKQYLENEKSVNYAKTPNYRNLLRFIDAYQFDVYIMGHSCGKSDRTLLNSIFEHKNCKTIKSFYYINENGIDDQNDRIMNLYLNFKDKSLFREKVIDKTNCEPLLEQHTPPL